jgi:hypothetical protein
MAELYRPVAMSLKSDDILPAEDEVTWDMISLGADAYRAFDPEIDEPEALVFAIISRAFKLAKRNREAKSLIHVE